MNSNVMVLARVHLLWQLRARFLLGMVFLIGMINGVAFFTMKEWQPRKSVALAGMYCLLGMLSCLAATFVDYRFRRARITDVERSLPASEQDWLRAGLINRFRVPVLAFAGALLAHCLVSVFSPVPASTLTIGLVTLGCAVLGISVGQMALGDQERLNGWRIFLALLSVLLAIGVPVLSMPIGIALACASPIAAVVAWKLAPTRLQQSARPVEDHSASADPSSSSIPASKSAVPASALQSMWRHLALRNVAWWFEVVFAPAMWIAFFVPLFGRFPFFTVGLGWCAVVILTIRPTPGDESVLRSVRHLPFPRRKLFPILGIKIIVMPAVALLGVAIAASWMLSEDRSTRFSWEHQSIQASEDASATPTDVVIPGEHWRIAFDDAPIEVKLRGGESLFVQPRFAYPGIYIWHPYQLPENCSVTVAREQVSRALQDIHGIGTALAELEEQIVARPDGIGVTMASGHGPSFSDGRSERSGTLARIADAPLLFLPLLLVLALAVLARTRVRQLPARKLLGGVLVGRFAMGVAIAVALHWLIVLGPSDDLQILMRVVLAGMRSWLVVPAWMLFGICVLGTWLLWRVCARRFDQMEAPPALPVVDQRL